MADRRPPRADGGELTTRGTDGSVSPVTLVRGKPVAGTVTIFVHGYNTSEGKARDGYHAHVERLRSTHRYENQLSRVYWWYWPGDWPVHVPILGKALSTLAYPFMIDRARRSGRAMAAYLRGLPSHDVRVRFVAHSLGNRVVLETLRELERLGPSTVVVDRVHLMAAAVPVVFCEVGSTFGPTTIARQETVSYSLEDSVLGAAFPPGEMFETPGRAEAVGRRGNPPGRWSSRYDSHLDHGDYWKDAGTAKTTAYSMGWTNRRPTPSRTVPRRTLKQRLLLGVARVIEWGG